VVRCRGLPYSAKADELREFFAGLTVARDGVALCMGLDGRPNGEAFVRFEDAADAVKALGRDREKMDRRYIEVFAGKEADMRGAQREAARAARGDSKASSMVVVRLRGLPFSATEREVEGFLGGVAVRRGGVHFVVRDGRPSGDAYVELEGEAEVHAPIQSVDWMCYLE
jgi:heterogeneous nuclear ribonucleoprotein F/H